MKQNMGAYSDSRGHQFIRDNVKSFIAERDQKDVQDAKDVQDVKDVKDVQEVYLYEGTVDALSNILQVILRDASDVCLLSTPSLPAYSAQVLLKQGSLLHHPVHSPSTELTQLNSFIESARSFNRNVKALLISNPSPFDLHTLTTDSIQQIIKLAYQN